MKSCGCVKADTTFFHPDYTVGPGVSPVSATSCLAARGLVVRLTAGGELRPALKVCNCCAYYSMKLCNAACTWCTYHAHQALPDGERTRCLSASARNWRVSKCRKKNARPHGSTPGVWHRNLRIWPCSDRMVEILGASAPLRATGRKKESALR